MKLFVLTILLAYAQVTSAAMPGMAVTDGFGVPVEAAIGSPSKVWEDCNSTTDDGKSTWPFVPATMDGCKAKCKELYPDISAAELTTDTNGGVTTPKCCCQGLTKAQSEMTWCHYANTGSKAYYWLTCDTMAEPKACIDDDSLTNTQKLALYQNGSWDCKADDTLNSGTLVVSSTLAPMLSLFLTLVLAIYRSP